MKTKTKNSAEGGGRRPVKKSEQKIQMMASNTGNLWNVKSIYDFRYFNCPSCSNKYDSKQDFVNHTSFIHPESIEYLQEISDGSLSNILQPWVDENVAINVKYKVEE